LSYLLERTTPWLVDVGSWIFGGLMAINLVVISALITVGPVDAAIRMSTAGLAGALPLNVTGIVLLKLIKDVKDLRLDDLTLQSFQEAGFPDIDAYFPLPQQRAFHQAKRTRVALVYASGIAVLNIALTVTGVAAALWHMGRWIAFVLLSTVALSVFLVAMVFAQSLPPESDAEKALKARYRESRSKPPEL
jgi:hypothetical protein